MKHKKQSLWAKITSILIASFFLASCAVAPSKVTPAYVSPSKYSGYDCAQIQQEHNRLSKELADITKKQHDAYICDEVSFWVGMFLLWPVLFFMIGGDHEDELSKIKGDFETISALSIEKKCGFTDEIQGEE